MAKRDKVQITIDVSDNPDLRKAFRIAADQLEVGKSRLGKMFFTFGLWLASNLSLTESLEVSKIAERDYPLVSFLATIIELKRLGYPKVRELERLSEDVRVFLEKRRYDKNEDCSNA